MRTLALLFALAVAQPAAAQIAPAMPVDAPDRFFWLQQANKASLLALVEAQIVEPALARRLARGLLALDAAAGLPGADRPENYLVQEAWLVERIGPEASRLHSGRSRQDMGQVARRAEWREAFLDAHGAFLEARLALLALARSHPHEVLPFYTHAVQAQPITLGHYLGGYLAALERHSDRMMEDWPRLNASPMGGGVGATSAYPLDRALLAQLLGFDRVTENSFDAVQIALQDSGSDIAFTQANGMLLVSMLTADLLTQYGNPQPWFQLREGPQSGTSSIMPHKRNPSALEELQEAAGLVTGLAGTWTALAQNIPSGLDSYKKTPLPLSILASAGHTWQRMAAMLAELEFHPDRARARVDEDWSVMSQLADRLQIDHGVPFRTGHRFASELTGLGRARGLRPMDIAHDDASALWARVAGEAGRAPAFPLSPAAFALALDARAMVASTRPTGGPAPAEVERMLAAAGARIAADRIWHLERKRLLAAAGGTLAGRIEALAHGR